MDTEMVYFTEPVENSMSNIGGHEFVFQFKLDDPSNFRRSFRSPAFQTQCPSSTTWAVYCSFFPIKTRPNRLYMYFKLERSDEEVTLANTTMEIEFWDKDDESFYYAYFSLPVYSTHNPILKEVPIPTMTVCLPRHKVKSLAEKKLLCTIYFNIDDKCVPVPYSPTTDTYKFENLTDFKLGTSSNCKTGTSGDCKTQTPEDCKTGTSGDCKTQTPEDCKTGTSGDCKNPNTEDCKLEHLATLKPKHQKTVKLEHLATVKPKHQKTLKLEHLATVKPKHQKTGKNWNIWRLKTVKLEHLATVKTKTPEDCKTGTSGDCKTKTPEDCKTGTSGDCKSKTPEDCKTGTSGDCKAKHQKTVKLEHLATVKPKHQKTVKLEHLATVNQNTRRL
ncbi:hypothetical protein CEXT_249901 [Caerostris extrusa]|uniref:Uncharacterized protein n=1 Tax=Caerostris extrusa TaxID=172846 RepID=A0AAV4W7B5_CAEEX|nr:hypothetical protein CEXT_249901 [Caerostris extrusa]